MIWRILDFPLTPSLLSRVIFRSCQSLMTPWRFKVASAFVAALASKILACVDDDITRAEVCHLDRVAPFNCHYALLRLVRPPPDFGVLRIERPDPDEILPFDLYFMKFRSSSMAERFAKQMRSHFLSMNPFCHNDPVSKCWA